VQRLGGRSERGQSRELGEKSMELGAPGEGGGARRVRLLLRRGEGSDEMTGA
jgi:hypothetical protein